MVHVLDRDHARLLEHCDSNRQFIDQGVAARGGTLVHCRYGVSRSATAMLADLILDVPLAPRFLRELRQSLAPAA